LSGYGEEFILREMYGAFKSYLSIIIVCWMVLLVVENAKCSNAKYKG